MILRELVGQVHVVPQAVYMYRDARGGGGGDWLDAHRQLAALVAHADPVERRVDPEVWSTVDVDHKLVITARVLMWPARTPRHAVVLGISCRPTGQQHLREADWTLDAAREYGRSLGVDIEQAERELAVACHEARPIDVGTSRQTWRYRHGLTGVDASLIVEQGDEGPVVVMAKARPYRSRGRR